MSMIFIETGVFTKEIKELLPDDDYRMLQTALMYRPDAGDIIRGGIRDRRLGRQAAAVAGGSGLPSRRSEADGVVRLQELRSAIGGRGTANAHCTVMQNGKTYVVSRHTQLDQFTNAQLSPEFGAWRDAIKVEGSAIRYEAVDSGTGEIDVGDPAVRIEVLGPRLETVDGQPAYRWLGDASHTINGHSVVLRLLYQDIQALFPGDLNEIAEKYLLEAPGIRTKFSSHVFKAPHHGSHEYDTGLLSAIRPQISVISSGDDPDHGHPRACFVGAVGRASRSDEPLVFSTAIAANFEEIPAGEEPHCETGGGTEAEDRRLFKRRLHGMINVRTDGRNLYTARRVAAGYWWEAYGPLTATP